MSIDAQLPVIASAGTEKLFVSETLLFLWEINQESDGMRLIICKLYPSKYTRHHASVQDMTTTITSEPEVLAVEVSALDTKLVTVVHDNGVFGMVYHNTSGMA